MQTWKVSGHDALHVKLLKVANDDEPILLEHLHAIFVAVWNGGKMPLELKDSVIKVLHTSMCVRFYCVFLFLGREYGDFFYPLRPRRRDTLRAPLSAPSFFFMKRNVHNGVRTPSADFAGCD